MAKLLLVVLYVFAVIGIALGLLIFLVLSRSAEQGTEGLIAVLIGVVALVGAAIVTALLRLTDHVERAAAEAAISRRDAAAR